VFPPLVRRLHISSELDRGAASAARGAEARSKTQKSVHVAGGPSSDYFMGLAPAAWTASTTFLTLSGVSTRPSDTERAEQVEQVSVGRRPTRRAAGKAGAAQARYPQRTLPFGGFGVHELALHLDLEIARGTRVSRAGNLDVLTELAYQRLAKILEAELVGISSPASGAEHRKYLNRQSVGAPRSERARRTPPAAPTWRPHFPPPSRAPRPPRDAPPRRKFPSSSTARLALARIRPPRALPSQALTRRSTPRRP
jgi:hypothetical protein